MSRQKLGQHFLSDPGISKKIVDSFEPFTGDLIEIGPGKGFLTAEIVSRNPKFRFTGIEKDPDLVNFLKERFGSRVTILNEDIRKVNLKSISDTNNINIIGNIPYYISKDIISWIISNSGQISKGTILVQTEFFEKISAHHNSSNYGPAGIIFGYIYDIKKNFEIKPGSFSPPPKVKSTLFTFNRNEKSIFQEDVIGFHLFLKKIFSARRKTILNNLKATLNKDLPKEIFPDTGINPNSRAENISPDNLYKLYKNLKYS